MCDYSLESLRSRPAKVGDKLMLHNFGTGTNGFVGVEDAAQADLFGERPAAVCLLPGTEVAFDERVRLHRTLFSAKDVGTVAIFREVDKDKPNVHHDAFEFAGGEIIKVTLLNPIGLKATVLQLPAEEKKPEVVTTEELFTEV